MERHEITAILPEVMAGADLPSSPFAAMLDAMVTLADPVEAQIKGIHRVADPLLTPDRMIDMLLGWFDLAPVARAIRRHALPDDSAAALAHRLRRLLVLAPVLLPQRGTAPGLAAMLDAACGISGTAVSDSATFHISVTLPAGSGARLPLARRIVELERPVFVTYTLS